MKKIILLSIALFLGLGAYAQRIDESQVNDALAAGMREYDATEGIVTVMDAGTGEVLNVSSVGISGDQRQLLSTPMRTTLFSTFALEASLQTGKVSADDMVKTGNGKKKIQDREIYDHNWKRGGYGKISVKQGFALNSYI